MTVTVFPETVAPVVAPASAGGHVPIDGVPVALAFEHAHEWIPDAGLIGLFQCAAPSCEKHAVCPGCVPHPAMTLAASAAGFVVFWCVLHCDSRLRKGAAR